MSVKKTFTNASQSTPVGPATTSALTYYVATTGSDANPGTSAAPFLTIQKAIDLIPKQILHPVQVNVGAGNFGGYNMADFLIGIPTDLVAGAYFQMTGTMIAVTPATGLGTGTATAGTAGSASTPSRGTLTDGSQSWTVNDLRGKFIHTIAGTGSAQYLPIVSNTATAITVCGAWTAPANGTTYEIIQPGTVINTSLNAPTGAFNSFATSTFATGVRIINCGAINVGTGQYFQHQFMKFASPTTAVTIYGYGQFSHRFCTFSGTGTQIQVLGPAATSLPDSCSFLNSSAQTAATIGSLSENAFFRPVNCFFLAGASGIGATNATLSPSSCTFLSQTTAAITFLSGVNNIRSNANFIDNAASGYLASDSASGAGSTFVEMYAANGQMDNCSVGINFSGAGIKATLGGAWAGAGCTTVISVKRGSAVQAVSTVATTGTTELSIDGTATTYAAMRAATPKCVTDPNFGSKVYEGS